MFTLQNFFDIVEDTCKVERFPCDLECYGEHTSVYSAYVKDNYEFCVAVNDSGVHEINFYDYKNSRFYRWTDPRVEALRDAELLLMDINPKNSGDTSFIDLIVIEDMIEKMTDVSAGRVYDTRIQIPLELTDEEFILIARAAHELDITLNEFVVRAVQEQLRKIA